MKQINQKHKDSLFRLLFGREDMKDNIMNMVITEFNEVVSTKNGIPSTIYVIYIFENS